MIENENNFIKISPIHLSLKNNSLQTSISKDLSTIKSPDENPKKINIYKKNQTLKNFTKYISLIHYQNGNYSTISAHEPSIEIDKGKLNNSIFPAKLNFNSVKKKTYYNTIRFKPKKSINNFPSLKVNSQNNKILFRNGKIDIELPLNKLKNEHKVKSSDNILNLYRDRIDEDIINYDIAINNKKVINLKAEQIKFFSKISDDFKFFKKFINYISPRNKETLNSYLSKLSNLIESQRNILFIDNDGYNYLESPGKNEYNNINNAKSQEIKTKDKKKIDINEQKVHNLFNNEVIFKFLNSNNEYNIFLYKCFDLVFNELKELKENNMELVKKNYENDILLITKNKKLKETEKYLNSNEIKAFIYNKKKRENFMKELSIEFNQKKNKYVSNIYNLNYEIKELLLLLNRNKDYYNKFKEIEKREKTMHSEENHLKAHLTYQLEKKEAEFQNVLELNSDLNEKINKLEEIVNDLKNKNEDLKLQEVQYKTKIKKLFEIINERNEMVNMSNEELNYYIMKYNKEVKNHEYTLTLLKQVNKRFG